jgi:uncharacterized membrane protein YoaK (UPF0700 family)
MTTDVTRFMMDVGTLRFPCDANGVADASSRARQTWPAIVGFTVGCRLGALLEVVIGPWSLALPTGFALLALALGFSIKAKV